MNNTINPEINVGLLVSEKIEFELSGNFINSVNNSNFSGKYTAILKSGQIEIFQGSTQVAKNQMFTFIPQENGSDFEIKDIVIGIDFHWQRKENQRFKGCLHLILNNDKIQVINKIHIEKYLESVISSEMNPESPLEFLKAHSVISRSWLLAQISKSKNLNINTLQNEGNINEYKSDNEWIKWFDREAHTLFDVCADDHCQRYQGITKQISDITNKVISQTYGLVLISDNEICDTRFSKCCGGITEKFQNTWQNINYPYLQSFTDKVQSQKLEINTEADFRDWFNSSPDVYCNTIDSYILSKILPGFDQETKDFFRWQVSYNQEDIKQLIYEKSQIDFGEIINLKPIERGPSGRIIKLEIEGTKKSLIVGKELLIRKLLSKTHLYSSAFFVEKEYEKSNIPSRFILKGAGWGHGVGLCQIGAAVMAVKGFTFNEILTHYFPGAALQKVF